MKLLISAALFVYALIPMCAGEEIHEMAIYRSASVVKFLGESESFNWHTKEIELIDLHTGDSVTITLYDEEKPRQFLAGPLKQNLLRTVSDTRLSPPKYYLMIASGSRVQSPEIEDHVDNRYLKGRMSNLPIGNGGYPILVAKQLAGHAEQLFGGSTDSAPGSLQVNLSLNLDVKMSRAVNEANVALLDAVLIVEQQLIEQGYVDFWAN